MGGRVRPMFAVRCPHDGCSWFTTDWTASAAAVDLFRHRLLKHDVLPKLAECTDAVEELIEESEASRTDAAAEESENQQLMELQ